jgi:hypothetical protein
MPLAYAITPLRLRHYCISLSFSRRYANSFLSPLNIFIDSRISHCRLLDAAFIYAIFITLPMHYFEVAGWLITSHYFIIDIEAISHAISRH